MSNNTVARLAVAMIRNAIDRCRKQIEARVNVPWAWASRALLHLFVEEPYEALGAVGQLIRLCEPPGNPSAAAEDVAWAEGLSAAGRARPAHPQRAQADSMHSRKAAGLRLVRAGRFAGPGRWP